VITEGLLETTDDSEPETTSAGQSVEATAPVYVGAPVGLDRFPLRLDVKSG
jgi:hypothetical protein